MDDADHRDERGRLLPGHTLSVGAGRPRGARNKLGEDFIRTLADDFAEHGVETIQKVRKDDPTAYAKIIASILPREVISALLVKNEHSFDPAQIAEIGNFALAYNLALKTIGSQLPPMIEQEDADDED